MRAITARTSQRVSNRAAGQERDRREHAPGEPAVEIKKRDAHDCHLQNRNHALFDAVDQDALDRVHILDHPGDQIAGRAIIEPAQGQPLDVPEEIAPQIEDDFLFETIVE